MRGIWLSQPPANALCNAEQNTDEQWREKQPATQGTEKRRSKKQPGCMCGCCFISLLLMLPQKRHAVLATTGRKS